jgi:poly(3-hydroxybutyrate) depolymerase
MTLRLLCTHADFFASGAPIGALEGCEFEGANAPSEEVDILQVHGHSDAVVSFDAVAIPQRDAILGRLLLRRAVDHRTGRWAHRDPLADAERDGLRVLGARLRDLGDRRLRGARRSLRPGGR